MSSARFKSRASRMGSMRLRLRARGYVCAVRKCWRHGCECGGSHWYVVKDGVKQHLFERDCLNMLDSDKL